MIDAHNHLQDPRFMGQQEGLIQTMQSADITACIVNGTCEQDWPKIAELADRFPDFIRPAFGLHPWKAAQASEIWLEKLRNYLVSYPRSSIGECGLDRWMDDPQIETQLHVFRQHLALGIELHRPVTIHCLKAWGLLLSELKNAAALPRFLLHSFSGSLEVAQECLKLGAYFSFSGHFLHPRKKKIRELFQTLPPERILVESDAPDMSLPDPEFPLGELNHPANLRRISKELEKLTGINSAQLIKNTEKFGR